MSALGPFILACAATLSAGNGQLLKAIAISESNK